jgi:hypothetical protein
MNAETLKWDQIRTIGINVLNQSLGPVGMIRFFQQTETGWGNYTRDRESWLGDPDLQELFETIQAREDSLTRCRDSEQG